MTARDTVHDLTNQLTCVSGYLELEDYRKARSAALEAIRLLAVLRDWLRTTEGAA